jgi:hypothetical protein
LKTLTKDQLIEQHRRERGRIATENRYDESFTAQKREAYAAATKLLEEAGRLMSRAGYMIGKINGDNSR